jgi:hypothetical protein
MALGRLRRLWRESEQRLARNVANTARVPKQIHRLMTPTTLSTHRPTAFHARTTERAARAPRHDRHTTGAKNGPETGAPPTLAPLLPAPRLSRLPAPRSRPGAEFDAFEPCTSLLFSLA